MISIIVAYDKKFIIGNKGCIPWKIPEDISFFKKTTTNSNVIMGRKTWDGLHIKPLPNRYNIVCSQSSTCFSREAHSNENLIFVPSVQEAIHAATKYKNTFVIGGESIYRKFLELNIVDRIIATEINDEFEGDRTFPADIFKSGRWMRDEVFRCEKYKIVNYDKR